MEKPSKLFIPLAAAAAMVSADNALADGSGWGKGFMEGPPPSASAAFCEELRNAKGPNIKDYIWYVTPNPSHFSTIRKTINKQITTVIGDGEEVMLSCTYNEGEFEDGTEGPKVESFKELLPHGPAIEFMAITPTATYKDIDLDSFPDFVVPVDYDTYAEAMKGQNTDTWGVPCVEGQIPDVCEELGVGLDDFDAAIAAGRKALTVPE